MKPYCAQTSEASYHCHELRSFKKKVTKIDFRSCLLMTLSFYGCWGRLKEEVIQKKLKNRW